jgi:hypothetical protein
LWLQKRQPSNSIRLKRALGPFPEGSTNFALSTTLYLWIKGKSNDPLIKV